MPVTCIHENGALIGHSAHGMKLDMWRKNREVCDEVQAHRGPGKTALRHRMGPDSGR